MNSGEEIARELVVAGGDSAEVLEPAKAAFDNVAAFVGALVEGMDVDAIGLVGNDRLGAAIDDLGTQFVAVVSFVGDERAHGWGKRQHIGRGGDVGILAGREMKNDWSAERIAQTMDFGRAPAARAADGLILLPPFPPEAQR